jgi:hypothetical protein
MLRRYDCVHCKCVRELLLQIACAEAVTHSIQMSESVRLYLNFLSHKCIPLIAALLFITLLNAKCGSVSNPGGQA